MEREGEAVLRVLVAEGLVDLERGETLDGHGPQAGLDLLDRLHAEQRISAETFASLRGRILELSAEPDEVLTPTVSIPGDADRAGEGFPISGWDRYRPIRFLGQGGMGRVFLAQDLRLDRKVAIKFVRSDNAALGQRFVAEARAQARVSDERVCQVFDVGEIQSRFYIAMQYIDGRTLSELADELSYEQKAMVLRGAALGVSEAHRVGLIHRDLKPSNIMVERGEGGELRPFVMDFGIARDWNASSTLTGTVLGTPQFMAPEQARGEVKQLDRRADVYSLGATLYALLVKRAPIDGTNQLEVLARISTFEPPRPRTIDPELPLDLEAIVMKCLEKERGARYDSARALADDLGRFLGGEPVLARASAGMGYRLRKLVRRRRRLVAALAVALVAVAIALGFGINERRRAARREALAQRFTERVERVEALARYSALAPAHDVRGDRTLIQKEMAAIAAEMRAAGELAAGPGHYALGRGQLALGEDEQAERQLREAWRRGFRQPRAAYALALAEGRLYQRGLRVVEALPRELRPARREELQRRYRDPAHAHLLASAGAEVPSREYVAALLAFHEGDFAAALAALDRARDGRHGEAPGRAWFYELPLLRGQILQARAMFQRGEATPAQTAADLEAGRQALAAAAAIGESDPAIAVAEAELEAGALAIEMYGGGAVDAPFARGLAAAERALAIDPERVEALVLRARLGRAIGEFRGNLGEDTTARLGAAIADAERALALAPGRPEVQLELSRCYRQLAELQHSRDLDPGEALRRAAEVAATIAAAERRGDFWIHVGLVHKIWADHQDQTDQDATGHRRQAIDAYRQALALNERLASAWLNLGINYYARAQQAPNQDATAEDDLAQAVAALERGRALLPRSVVPDFYAGEIYALAGRRKQARGEDPEPDRRRAIAQYQRGLATNPSLPHLHNGLSIVQLEQAVAVAAAGADPSALFALAEASAARAIAAAPDQVYGHNNLGDVLARRAADAHRRGLDPRPLAGQAVAAFSRGLAVAPDYDVALLNLAEAHLLVAVYDLDAGRDPRPRLALAEASLARTLARHPRDPKLVSLISEAAALAARVRAPRE